MTQPTLVRLSDTPLTVADPAEDIRGRAVHDNSGRDIGHVEDLFIDDSEKKVRFLEVASGGFLGLGERKFLIPIELIAGIDKHDVQINRTGDEVAESPL